MREEKRKRKKEEEEKQKKEEKRTGEETEISETDGGLSERNPC